MPNRDGKGPDKAGPMTGRGRGACRRSALTPEQHSTETCCTDGAGKHKGRRQGRGRHHADACCSHREPEQTV